MAGGNMGALNMELIIKSNIDQVLKSNLANLEKARQEVEKYKKSLQKAEIANDNAGIKRNTEGLKEAKAKVRELEGATSKLETRAQQILTSTHNIANVIKDLKDNSGNIRLYKPGELKDAGHELSRIIGLLRQMSASTETSPLVTGTSFRSFLGEAKRGISDIKKETSGLTRYVTKEVNAANKKFQKAKKQEEDAEEKALEYYRVRKLQVDKAIQSLSERQAGFSKLAQKSSAEDAQMLKVAGEQAEILKQRLLAAKTEYEELQRTGGKLSSTFLGSKNGMSELFGANFSSLAGDRYKKLFGDQFDKQDNLSYSGFLSYAKEIVTLTQQHNAELKKQEELQDRISKKTNPLEQRHDNNSTYIKGAKELEQQEKRNQDAIDKTAEHYKRLSDVLHNAFVERSRSRALGINTDDLSRSLPRVIELWRELHNARALGIGANNYANAGEDKVSVDTLSQLVRAQRSLNTEKERQLDLDKKQAERGAQARLADNKTAANALKGIEQQEKKNERAFIAEQKQIDATKERYAQLRVLFSEGINQKGLSKLFGQDSTKLTEDLRRIVPMLMELRQAVNAGTYSSELFKSGDSKILIDELKERIRLQQKLNREAEKGYTDNRNISVKNARFDTAPIERQIEKYEKAIAVYQEMRKIQEEIRAGAAMGARNQHGNVLAEDYTRLKQQLDVLRADFENFGNGFSFKRIQQELSSLYALLEQFNNANANAKPLVKESHNEWTLEKQRVQAAEKHAQRQRELEEMFAKQEREEKRVTEFIEQRRRAQENAAKQEKENIAQQEQQYNALEAKLRQLASTYSQLRTERDRISKLGGDTSGLDAQLQHLRELFSQLNTMRWDKGARGGMAQAFVEADNAIKQVGVDIKKAQENATQMETQLKGSVTAARDLASAFDRVHNSASKSSQVLSDIKSLFLQGGIVFAAQQFANSIIKTGGDIVQQHIALRSILGDVQKADTLFAQTQQLALQSPFTFQELNRDVKQLAAFGVDTDRLYDTTKRLADVASGLGVSFERLGLAYGQVKARSWLDGKELRQFAYAGLPMLQKIADLYNETGKNGRRNYTTSDVRTMITKRQVSFEDVDEVFKRLTDEGGQFYNMQFVLSDTLLGKWNKLQDAWTIMLGKFADGGNILGGAFIGVIDQVTKLIQMLDQLSPAILTFGSLFALRKGAGMLSARFGAGTIIADMQKAQSLAQTNFAIRQMTRVAEGEITMQQARQNIETQKNLLASRETANLKYMQLAAEGKLSAFQLGRLAANKQVNLSLVNQLLTTGQISHYQALLIIQAQRYAGTLKGVWAEARLGATSLWGSIKGLFSWSNVLFVGIGAVMSTIMSHEQKVSQMSSEAEGAAQRYKNKASEINEVLNQVNGKVSKDSVSAMESALSKAGQLTDEVKRQVQEASTLTEKYEILRDKMQQTLAMAQQLKNEGVISRALQASGGDMVTQPGTSWYGNLFAGFGNFAATIGRFFGGFENYISDNISKANEYANAINNMVSGLSGNFDAIDKALKKTTDTAHDSVFYEQVKDLPFEQKIRQILSSNYADDFLDELDDIDSGAYKTAKKLKKYIENFNEIVDEVTKKNVPNAVQSLKNDMGLLGTDAKNWSQQQVTTFVWMFSQIMVAAGEMSDYVRSKVWQSFLVASGLNGQLNPSGLRVVTYTNPKTHKPWKTIRLGDEGDDKKGHYVVTGFGKNKQPIKTYNPAADKPQTSSLTGSSETTSTDKGKAAEAARRERKEVEGFRNRIELYKKFYSEYTKLSEYYGKNGALQSLKDSGDFKTVFSYGLSDVSDYSKSIDELTSKIGRATEARAQLVDNANATKAEKAREDMIKRLEQDIADVNYQLDQMTAKYDIYKRITSATGNTSIAGKVAFGWQESDDMSPRNTRDLIKQILVDNNDGWTRQDAETFLNLDRSTVSNTYGMKSTYGTLWQAGQKDQTAKIKEAGDLYVDLITKHQTIAEQIDAENLKYKERLELLEKLNLSPEEKEKRRGNLQEDHNQTIGDLEFKQFKQDSNWENVFRDIDRLSSDFIRRMLKQLRGLLSTNDMSEENVRTIVETMDKLQERLETTSPFSSMADGYSRLSEVDKILAGGPNRNGKYVLSREQASRLRLKPNSKDEYTKEELNSVKSSVFKGFSNSLKGIQEGFEALQQVLQPVTDLFSALGVKGLAEGMGVANGALSSAVNVAGGLGTLGNMADNAGMEGLKDGIGKATPYVAGAAAALSVASSLINSETKSQKRYEKQAAFYRQMVSVTNTIAQTLSEKVSSSYGSLSGEYAIKARQTYEGELAAARETYLSWTNAKNHHGGHRNRMKTGLDYDMLNEWLEETGNNPGYWVGSQEIQNLSGSVLEEFRNTHAKEWAMMNEQAREYLEKIIEIDGETGKLKTLDEQLVESLTGLEKDNLVSEYADLLDDLDSANEDFADNFEKHLREAILNTMVANLYKDELEKLYEQAGSAADTEEGQYIDKNGNIKTHTGGDDAADVMSEYTQAEYDSLMQSQEALAERMRADRDFLENLYGWSDSDSSMSSSVKGMSEDTGDVIAAYLNAIRADVSIIRQFDTLYLPKLDVTTQAQLQQQIQIAQNTLRNADAAERIEVAVNNIYDMFNRTTNGAKPIGVKVY